jgi:hypothetical protein
VDCRHVVVMGCEVAGHSLSTEGGINIVVSISVS